MQIQKTYQGTLVKLSTPLDSRVKYIHLAYALVAFFAGCVFLALCLDQTQTWLYDLIVCLVAAIFLVVFAKFLGRAIEMESLLIGTDEIVIVRSRFLRFNSSTYKITRMSDFRYREDSQLTNHPISGGTIDHFGFQTDQKVINDMHGFDYISFLYNGRKVTFGQNVMSWDFSELSIIISDITGKDLRHHDEFESGL